MPNVILEEYLAQTNDICKITDAVCAMGKKIEERMGIKKKYYRRNNKTTGNRRIQKIEKELKDTRIMVCANCKRDIPQENAKESNTEREKKY